MQTQIEVPAIVEDVRGPQIVGTRITVYDVLDYLRNGWHRDEITRLFRLSSGDIQAAIDYIEAHRQTVEEAYARIVDRHQRYRYRDEVQIKVDQARSAARRRQEEIGADREDGNVRADA